jgi:Mrp family chromosome partitioning ATPase
LEFVGSVSRQTTTASAAKVHSRLVTASDGRIGNMVADNGTEKRKKNAQRKEQERRMRENLSKIRHQWLVVSRGAMVGLLDTDIHGPDVMKMLGVEGQMLANAGREIEPIMAYPRLKVVSMAALMPDPDVAVVWRGPMKMKAIRQFLTDVSWGELDHLVVDSPPGTGDEPLSSAQLIGDADGAIIVTSPQEVALLDSRKCVDFARQLKVPVTGIIENMSGMVCPHCNRPITLFGTGGGKRAATELGVNFLGSIPVDPTVVISGDQGRPFMLFQRGSQAAEAFGSIVDGILAMVPAETEASARSAKEQQAMKISKGQARIRGPEW